MSVAMNFMSQASRSGKYSRISIRRLNGSWPVEHGSAPDVQLARGATAFHQLRQDRLAQGLEGMQVAEKRGLVGRHRADDLAVDAVDHARAKLADEGVERGDVLPARQGLEAGLDEVLLFRLEDDGGLRADKAADKVEIGGGHDAVTGRCAGQVWRLPPGLQAGADPAIDLEGQLGKGKDLVRQSGLAHGTRHSPDDARRLILGEDLPSRVPDILAAPQPVLPHAGEDDAEGPRAVEARDRTKEHVHRRAAGILPRPLVKVQPRALAGGGELHVKAARSDPGLPGSKQGPLLAFPGGKAGDGGEALGQEAREQRPACAAR